MQRPRQNAGPLHFKNETCDFDARLRPETRARLSALAKYVLAIG